jgi:hypothetical protein
MWRGRVLLLIMTWVRSELPTLLEGIIVGASTYFYRLAKSSLMLAFLVVLTGTLAGAADTTELLLERCCLWGTVVSFMATLRWLEVWLPGLTNDA